MRPAELLGDVSTLAPSLTPTSTSLGVITAVPTNHPPFSVLHAFEAFTVHPLALPQCCKSCIVLPPCWCSWFRIATTRLPFLLIAVATCTTFSICGLPDVLEVQISTVSSPLRLLPLAVRFPSAPLPTFVASFASVPTTPSLACPVFGSALPSTITSSSCLSPCCFCSSIAGPMKLHRGRPTATA